MILVLLIEKTRKSVLLRVGTIIEDHERRTVTGWTITEDNERRLLRVDHRGTSS